MMVEEKKKKTLIDPKVEDLLLQAQELVPLALTKARTVKTFSSRWRVIITRLEKIPSSLSDLSSHPCFSKHTLCKEHLESVLKTLNEAIDLANVCVKEKQQEGKLKTQSDLDSLSSKIDLCLKDCGLLMKTGVLGDEVVSSSIQDLLARLQIGHLESKRKALEELVEVLKEDENSVISGLGRSNVASLVNLLTGSSSSCVKENAVSLICALAESSGSSGSDGWLLSENVLPPLIRLLESGSPIAKEKAVISLQRMSISSETSRAIVGHGGISPLIEICKTGDAVSQSASACTLKNISAVPEVRQSLAEEGIVKVMINTLNCGVLMGSKEYAAECLQNLTSSNEALKRSVISENGIQSLLTYLDGPLPQESGVSAIRNLVNSVSVETHFEIVPSLVHVLRSGSIGAQQAAVSTICRISTSNVTKRMIGESGCIPLLIKMLESKSSICKELASQAIASLVTVPRNCREVKKDEKSVMNLVRLLEPNPSNSSKKYAVSGLSGLSSSKKCRKMMVSYGAVGYLKKLVELEVPGSKKLLERIEKKKLRSLFSRK